MITGKNIVKRFDEFTALDFLSINIPDASVYGLVGPNGAGKTTLLNILTGVYRADEGDISMDGSAIYENPSAKERMCFIPDQIYFPCSNIKDTIEFYKGFYHGFSEDDFNALSSYFPYDRKKALRSFSKGQRRQIAFHFSLAMGSKYLILDEPMDGLDPVARHMVWGLLMEKVEKEGLTILVSSHNLRELEDVCDTVGIMEEGKVKIERNLEELQENMTKLQVVFKEGKETDISNLPILHSSNIGRVYTFIMKMSPEEALKVISPLDPLMAEPLPLTLEEIFIYEIEGAKKDVNKDVNSGGLS